MIFTSRCETQRFLMEHLTADLGLRAAAVVGLGGAMPDVEQTRVVEQFTQEKEAVRILVATKVASEGLNLHYLQPPAGVLRRSRSSGSRSQSRGLAHTSPPRAIRARRRASWDSGTRRCPRRPQTLR